MKIPPKFPTALLGRIQPHSENVRDSSDLVDQYRSSSGQASKPVHLKNLTAALVGAGLLSFTSAVQAKSIRDPKSLETARMEFPANGTKGWGSSAESGEKERARVIDNYRSKIWEAEQELLHMKLDYSQNDKCQHYMLTGYGEDCLQIVEMQEQRISSLRQELLLYLSHPPSYND